MHKLVEEPDERDCQECGRWTSTGMYRIRMVYKCQVMDEAYHRNYVWQCPNCKNIVTLAVSDA